jgi:hypothetical protein
VPTPPRFPKFFQWPQRTQGHGAGPSIAERLAVSANDTLSRSRRILQNLILTMIASFLAFVMAWGLYRSAQFLYSEVFSEPWTSKTHGGRP